MITYELVKQLKDAGFTAKNCSLGIDCGCDCHNSPTLSELIEACGYDNGKPLMYNLYWSTHILEGEHEIIDSWACNSGMSYGSTPEEAVARLWIELNKK